VAPWDADSPVVPDVTLIKTLKEGEKRKRGNRQMAARHQTKHVFFLKRVQGDHKERGKKGWTPTAVIRAPKMKENKNNRSGKGRSKVGGKQSSEPNFSRSKTYGSPCLTKGLHLEKSERKSRRKRSKNESVPGCRQIYGRWARTSVEEMLTNPAAAETFRRLNEPAGEPD